MTNLRPRRVDLDDIERQLQQIGPESAPSQHDPLAELARIVGQDDPFRAAQAADDGREIGPGDLRGAIAPDYRAYQPQFRGRAAPGSQSYATEPAGEYEAAYGQAGAHHAQSYAADDSFSSYPDDGVVEAPEPRRSRKGLVAVGGVLGLAVLGVGAAVALREPANVARSTTPPVIQADRAPLKIQPQNPGGMDIPDQNKQIYERGAPEGQTRVVNREEQPIDVQQAARSIATAPAAPAPSLAIRGTGAMPSSTATPGSGTSSAQTGSLAASLGEPKRVKTVSIRPDGTVMSDASAARPKPTPPAVPSVPAAASAPQAAATPVVPTAPARPRPDARPPVAAAPTAPALAFPAPTQTGSTQRDPAPPAQQRVAALGAAPAAAPKPETAAAGGGFVVQLDVRPSEQDARTAFQRLQKKFPAELAGKSPLIRKAEVNGNTVFRIRVGPLSREDAGGLCTRLQGAGGQCFVANN